MCIETVYNVFLIWMQTSNVQTPTCVMLGELIVLSDNRGMKFTVSTFICEIKCLDRAGRKVNTCKENGLSLLTEAMLNSNLYDNIQKPFVSYKWH